MIYVLIFLESENIKAKSIIGNMLINLAVLKYVISDVLELQFNFNNTARNKEITIGVDLVCENFKSIRICL